MTELFAGFLNVIMPEFGIGLLGYLLGGRLAVQTQTLTRRARGGVGLPGRIPFVPGQSDYASGVLRLACQRRSWWQLF